MSEKYNPISCSWHDTLLHKATLKEQVSFELESGQSLGGIIEDVYTTEKEEFLRLNSGEVIRLDKITTMDGAPFNSNVC